MRLGGIQRGAKNLFLFVLLFLTHKEELLKNISPTLWVRLFKHPNSINISPTLWVWILKLYGSEFENLGVSLIRR